MKSISKLFTLSIAVLLIQPASCADTAADEQARAKVARRILEAWRTQSPDPSERVLHLVCWTPADRELPDDYQARLTRIMEHIRDFYLREMERFGFADHTFSLPYTSDQQLVLHTVRGEFPMAYYEKQSGNEIRRECVPVLESAGINADDETIVILCHLATWDPQQLSFTHKSPYYAGGSFRSGTAWQLDSPELDSKNLTLTEPIIRDGQYGRISLGRHNSIFIGGIAHELGHALGLPHCTARPNEAVRGTALMGSGNRTYAEELRSEGRGSFLTFAHALRLASHPLFSGSKKGLQQRATAQLDELSIVADGKAIEVSGIVSGEPPVYAVVAYFDPEGGGDYDATTATAVPDADGRFTIRSDALRADRAGELRLFPLHTNGSAAGQMSRTRFQYPYKVAADGTPDLSTIQTRRELTPIIEALERGDRATATEISKNLQSTLAQSIVHTLLTPVDPVQSPSEFAGSEQSVPLTSFKPESTNVGWGRPTFNRIPDRSMLLESNGSIFETGIYAHAPAVHEYVVQKNWQRISGTVGLADGHPGSVQFEIQADGRSLWKSETVGPGRSVEFNVGLTSSDRIKLITHPTEDGNGSDWGLWLNPTLHRK